jgi:hypothetical protein
VARLSKVLITKILIYSIEKFRSGGYQAINDNNNASNDKEMAWWRLLTILEQVAWQELLYDINQYKLH